MHYIIDWNYDEDRGRARTGFGPENLTRLRRFAVGILKSFQKPAQSIAEMMRILCFRNRIVFDYPRMTKNSAPTLLGPENKFTVLTGHRSLRIQRNASGPVPTPDPPPGSAGGRSAGHG